MAQLKDLIVNGNARIITDLNVNGYETVDETVKVGRDPTANLEVATKQYVDNNSANINTAQLTLTYSLWVTNYIDVACTGMTSTATVWVSPATRADDELWRDYEVECSTQSTDTLTFTCVTVPLENITVNVAWA